MGSIVLETPRLALRHLHDGDAPFIYELLHDPGWLRFIGNKSVHSHEGAIEYIAKANRMYVEKGFGLWAVQRKGDGERLGLAGLIKRDTLRDVDLGFGFFERHCRQGYGSEAAAAVLEYARRAIGLKRIVAITAPNNAASCGLLEKIGFAFERTLQWAPGDEVKLYAA